MEQAARQQATTAVTGAFERKGDAKMQQLPPFPDQPGSPPETPSPSPGPEPSQPGSPTPAPPEINPPGPDIDTPAPVQPGTEPPSTPISPVG